MFDPRIPFTYAEALAAGITPGQLRGPTYRRLIPGVYVAATIRDDRLLRARAALRIHHPSAKASHFTAARIYRLPVPADADEHVTVGEAGHRTARRGVHSHVGDVADAVLVSGLRVSSAPQVFAELAAYLTPVELVVLGDAMLREQLVTGADLAGMVDRSRGRARSNALLAVRLVRPGSASPTETRLRLLMGFAGLPEPEVGYRLHLNEGMLRLDLDLAYPAHKLAVEYDGRQHADVRQWERDQERRADLERAGWRLVVVTSKGLFREPEVTLRRVADALRVSGASVGPLKDDWRPHFRQ